MVSTLEGAANATQQRKNQIQKHTVRELDKWKGMSSPTVKPKKTIEQKTLPPPWSCQNLPLCHSTPVCENTM
jgi:hypothetical protein